MSIDAASVWHLVPAQGAGVDRHVRDVCALRPADCIWHLGPTQWVREQPARGALVPLDAGTCVDLAFAGVLGRPRALHAHGTTGDVRRAAELLRAATGAPLVVTLHDVAFAGPDVDTFERDARLRFARGAHVRLAPSSFIVDLAARVLGNAAPCRWIDNGVDAFVDAGLPTDVPGPPDDGGFPIAVIGAIGEPKGLTPLMRVAERLPATLRVVVIGYTERLLTTGWLLPGRMWVHGAFEPAHVPGLVARYGPRLAFFPPGIPESYCYALSDAWLAGLPALVPNHGALAERVRRHGGGDVYPLDLDTEALARRVVTALAEATPACARAAAATLQTRRGMIAQMNEVYDALPRAGDERPSDDETLGRLARPHLDSHFFRPELLKLQRELAAALEEVGRLHPRVQQLEADLQRLGAEAQCSRDEAARLHDALRRQDQQAQEQQRQAQEQQRQAQEQQRQAQEQQAALERTLHDVQAELAAWQERYRALVARLTRPVSWLPSPVRDAVIRLGKRLMR